LLVEFGQKFNASLQQEIDFVFPQLFLLKECEEIATALNTSIFIANNNFNDRINDIDDGNLLQFITDNEVNNSINNSIINNSILNNNNINNNNNNNNNRSNENLLSMDISTTTIKTKKSNNLVYNNHWVVTCFLDIGFAYGHLLEMYMEVFDQWMGKNPEKLLQLISSSVFLISTWIKKSREF
jgi:hypothetical protein